MAVSDIYLTGCSPSKVNEDWFFVSSRPQVYIKIIKLIPATIPAQSTQTALTKQLKNIMQLALLEKPAKTDSALTLPAVLTQTAEPTDM